MSFDSKRKTNPSIEFYGACLTQSLKILIQRCTYASVHDQAYDVWSSLHFSAFVAHRLWPLCLQILLRKCQRICIHLDIQCSFFQGRVQQAFWLLSSRTVHVRLHWPEHCWYVKDHGVLPGRVDGVHQFGQPSLSIDSSATSVRCSGFRGDFFCSS